MLNLTKEIRVISWVTPFTLIRKTISWGHCLVIIAKQSWGEKERRESVSGTSCTEKPRHQLCLEDGPMEHPLTNGDSSAPQETQLSTLTGSSSARAHKNKTGSRSRRGK